MSTDRAQTEPGEERCPWHDTLVEALGRSGKNGRLGVLEKKVERLENLALKLIIASGAGGGLVAGAFKLFG